MVDESDVLHTLAEVSVAFAGFSGVVAVFGRRDPTTWSFADRLRFTTLIESSLIALLFCVLPSCLFALHLSEEAAWRTLSGLFAAYLVFRGVHGPRRIRAASSPETAEVSRGAVVIVLFLDGGGLLLNLYNVVLLGELGPFLAALLLLLTKAGFLFARLLLLSFRGSRAA
ncbi:MAG: hypothetical protein ACE5FG_14205 [Myxococcota bacterium]